MKRSIWARTAFALLLALLMAFGGIVGCGVVEQEQVEAVFDAIDALTGDAEQTGPAPPANPVISSETKEADGASQSDTPEESEEPDAPAIDEDGSYFSKDDVALYIHTYGKLPGNFITKNEARDLGWSGGSVEQYASGKAIGGDRFGNYEGLLPEAPGRTYTECDIDTDGASSRGAKRIVFSNDGLVYYTGDHYESFELLYGDPQ